MRYLESYLELAKRSRVRSSRGPRPPAATLAAVLEGDRRLTFEEVLRESGLDAETTRRQLGRLVDRGEVFAAVDLHRRVEVFWRRRAPR